jgi:hypothetical protein
MPPSLPLIFSNSHLFSRDFFTADTALKSVHFMSTHPSAMSKNKGFRTLLPAKEKGEIESVVTEAKKETRRNIPLACTECQKKKTKVTIPAYSQVGGRR